MSTPGDMSAADSAPRYFRDTSTTTPTYGERNPKWSDPEESFAHCYSERYPEGRLEAVRFANMEGISRGEFEQAVAAIKAGAA